MPWNSTLFRCLVLLALWLPAAGVQAQERPAGPIILEVSGAITRSNGDGVMRYDRQMLEALGTEDLATETPWTDGLVTFTGVPARALMEDVGAIGSVVDATALNDYTVTIPLGDFADYEVILAIEKDGVPLTVRDRGPVWVVYPWSDMRELNNDLYYARSIWQLQRLHVRPE